MDINVMWYVAPRNLGGFGETRQLILNVPEDSSQT